MYIYYTSKPFSILASWGGGVSIRFHKLLIETSFDNIIEGEHFIHNIHGRCYAEFPYLNGRIKVCYKVFRSGEKYV